MRGWGWVDRLDWILAIRQAAEAGLIDVVIFLDMTTGVCGESVRMTKILDDDDRDGLI